MKTRSRVEKLFGVRGAHAPLALRISILHPLFSLLFTLSSLLSPLSSFAAVPPVTHTLAPSGVYRVNNTSSPSPGSRQSENMNFYPCAVAGTHTIKGAAYNGTNGRGTLCGGMVAQEHRAEGGQAFSKTGTLTSSTTELKDSTVYTLGLSVETTDLAVEGGAIAVVFIPKGITLRAGIRVPPNSTLVICGEGTFEGNLVDTSSGKEEMGLVLILGPLVCKGDFGSTGLLYTARDASAPDMTAVSRVPDRTVGSYWPIHYSVTLRDDNGAKLGETTASLGMAYEPVDPPTRTNQLCYGFTNSVGKLVLGPHGKPFGNVCTTIGDHDIYAFWVTGINTTDDPKDYKFGDETVSLREVLDIIGKLTSVRTLDYPIFIPFSPTFMQGDAPLELTVRGDEPLVVSAPARSPVYLTGRGTLNRPLSINGGINRTKPLFSLTNNCALLLENVTMKNTSGAVDGLALKSDAGSTLSVSNVLFEAIDASSKSCLYVSGTAHFEQCSWNGCTGTPLMMDGTGVVAESTVVPAAGNKTLSVSLGAKAAALACTLPCGTTGTGTVKGCITNAIAEDMCTPVTALSTNLSNVVQYYYRVGLCSRLAERGKGVYVWHDDAWTNVAWSVERDGSDKTAVFGSKALATILRSRDGRDAPIDFPWNTCGAYAMGIRTGSQIINRTTDQLPKEIRTDDDIVTLREAIELMNTLAPRLTSPELTFASGLTNGTDELVFTFEDAPVSLRMPNDKPLVLDGASTGERPLVFDGGGNRNTPIFSLEKDARCYMSQLTVRNATGSMSCQDGLAITTATGSHLFVSNCLFSSVSASEGCAVLQADGGGSVVHSSWYDCGGLPFILNGSSDHPFTVAESTVVPKDGSTQGAKVSDYGAVMACTIPSGVTEASRAFGSFTRAIQPGDFEPSTAVATNVGKVVQYYYKVMNSALFQQGAGVFVWHDADWKNVARSVKLLDPKNAVFGSTTAATTLVHLDVTGKEILFLWNTCGSYAVVFKTFPFEVNTTEDPTSSDDYGNYEDEIVSLREAVTILLQMPGYRGKRGGVNQITFSSSLFDETGAATICLTNGTELQVSEQSFSEKAPLWIAGPINGDQLTIDCGRKSRYFSVGDGCALRLSAQEIANGKTSGNGGAVQVKSGASLQAEYCRFRSNMSQSHGGAIHSAGKLTLEACSFVTNLTSSSSCHGGAIYTGADRLTITRSRFDGNATGGFNSDGGAIYVSGAGAGTENDILVTQTTFFDNTASQHGGAVLITGATGRQVTFANCSFFLNTAGCNGGALHVSGGPDILFANDTIRGNTAGNVCGGIYLNGGSSLALGLVNVLCAGNLAAGETDKVDIYGYESGKAKVYSSMVQYAGSDFSTQSKTRVYTKSRVKEEDIFVRPQTSDAFSVIPNGTMQTADPIDYDNMTACEGAEVHLSSRWNDARAVIGLSSYDLRGDASKTTTFLATDITGRDFGTHADPSMGSFWCAADPVSAYVTTLRDVTDARDGMTSLREIVANLKSSADWREKLLTNGAYVIHFDPELAGQTIKLNGNALLIDQLGGVPVRVDGLMTGAITIDGVGRFRGFNVAAGNVLEIRNLVFENCCGTAIDDHGGAIRNAGSFVATNVAFYGCSAGPTNAAPAGWGGAVVTMSGATSRLERCSFVGNVAARGGAVAVREGGRLTVAHATFDGNGVRTGGSSMVERGNAAYVEGGTTDALFANCTFANNVGESHDGAAGMAAVCVEGQTTNVGQTALANCVVVGNGGRDLATTGRLRLVGTTYGVKTALDPAKDESATWFFNGGEEATCTGGVVTADVYAHTLKDGTPVGSERRPGAVRHWVLPLLDPDQIGKAVCLRANEGWTTVAWSATKSESPHLLRGESSIAAKRAPLVRRDQLGKVALDGVAWTGALIAREEKTEEDPPPAGPKPGAITAATYEAFVNAIETAMAQSPDDIVVFVTEVTSNAAINMTTALNLSGSCRVTIRGPLTLDAAGSGRIFSVAGGVTLRLEEVTLTGGDATVYSIEEDGGCGGAVYLFNENTSKLAKLEAERCTFTGNTAYYGGAVAALGLGCAESFVDCAFPAGSNFVTYDSSWDYGGDGKSIYHDDKNLTISGGTIDLNEIWPKPAYAVTTPAGATALFGMSTGCDDEPTDDITVPLSAAQTYAKTVGSGAKVIPLSTTAVAAKAAAAGVSVAAIQEEMTPAVTEITLSTSAGSADGKVSIAPQNVVPFMTYSIEYASSPEALGTPAAQSGNKVQADASGRLAEPLTAPANGKSGFYRVIAE